MARASRPSYHPSEAAEEERGGAGRWFLEQRSQIGLEAKDKRLARDACTAGMEDSSGAWGASNG